MRITLWSSFTQASTIWAKINPAVISCSDILKSIANHVSLKCFKLFSQIDKHREQLKSRKALESIPWLVITPLPDPVKTRTNTEHYAVVRDTHAGDNYTQTPLNGNKTRRGSANSEFSLNLIRWISSSLAIRLAHPTFDLSNGEAMEAPGGFCSQI